MASARAERMLEGVVDGGLLAAGRPVLVMLSGGRDSVCLLDVAVSVCGAPLVQALHVNYRLRPEAGEDQAHCEELCRSLGVSLVVRAGDPSARPQGNLQAWARQLRYEAAAELVAGTGADIAAGHTATDQVETILYRLASSPSRRALLGMKPREGSLVRPLLSYTREETAAYCRARELGWREDPTNSSEAFARGRVRTRVVPALREVHPAAEANVLALAALLRDEAAVLDELVDELLAGRREVPLAELRARPPALVRLLLQRLADEAAGRPAPGTARRAPEVLALGDHSSLDLPHGVRAEVRRGVLRFLCPYNRST